jgi:hypothetical protein
MKKCFKCGELKELSEFYKHPKMKDGRVNKCKECNKADVRENRVKNFEYYNKFDKVRYEKKGHRYKNKNYQQEYRKTEKSREVKRSWSKRNRSKRNAHLKVKRAIDAGNLIRPVICTICGQDNKVIHGHHWNYDLPLDVVWCCSECHGDIHADRIDKLLRKQHSSVFRYKKMYKKFVLGVVLYKLSYNIKSIEGTTTQTKRGEKMNKQQQLALLKIKQLSKNLSIDELTKVIQDMKFPLGFHLSVMAHLNFIIKSGRMPTKTEIKLGLA